MKDRKNKIEKEMAIAMNTGVVAVGAESKSSGAFPGSAEKSVNSTRGMQKVRRDAESLHGRLTIPY